MENCEIGGFRGLRVRLRRGESLMEETYISKMPVNIWFDEGENIFENFYAPPLT